MRTVRPELGFERLLAALERELLDATDEEIREAANELGMTPASKGSAALFGVLFTMKNAALRQRSAEKDATASRPRRRSKRGTRPSR